MAKHNRPASGKKVTVLFVPREGSGGHVREPYAIMERIIATERSDLVQAKIGIAWRIGWVENRWGQLTLGQCKKRTDLDRSLAAFDFVILLNKEAWSSMSGAERERLIYHELLHATVCFDDEGDEKRDEAGRLVTALRPHDIQEFRQVVERYGDDDLAAIAVGRMHDAERPLLAAERQSAAERDRAESELALAAADGGRS